MKTAICCIAKMENHYIREWVEWYKNIGVDNIILYDNNDIDGERFDDVISDYIDDGFIVVKNYRGRTQCQMESYQSCYDEYCNVYDWIGFFDSDEYLEIEKFNNVVDFLSQPMFDDANAIRLCWKNFDDNDLLDVVDEDYSINRFTRTVDKQNICNRTTKVIIRGGQKNFKFYFGPGGTHGLYINCKTKDCLGRSNDNNTFVLPDVVWTNAWVRHYRFKTIGEFCRQKMKRLYLQEYDLETSKRMLQKKDFFEYNKWTKEKEDLYNEIMEQQENIKKQKEYEPITTTRFEADFKLPENDKQKLVCTILNYKYDDNALRLYNALKNRFVTYLIDTNYLDNSGNCPFDKNDEHIVLCNNVYFGGSYIKAYEILKKENGDCLVAITADVEFDDDNLNNLIKLLPEIAENEAIGVWEPSAKQGSMCNGSTQLILTNIHQYNHGTNSMREVICGEGWFEFVRKNVCDMVLPYINNIDNKHGWGINDAFNRAARKLGLKVVIDDRVIAYHPAGTSYSNQEAAAEYEHFKARFQDLGLDEPQPKTPNEITTLICCIGKNENRYVRNYVEWYKNLGVTHICIYDNNDIDGERFEDVIGDYVNDGYVEIIDYRGLKVCQFQAYTECYHNNKNDYDWILFIDCGDEYLKLNRCNTIGEYLSMPQFINYDLIHVNLMTIGDNDSIEVNDRPLWERFPNPIPFDTNIAYNFPENCHVSSIVRGGLEDIKWEGNGYSHTPSPNNLRCCNNVGFTCDGNSPFANVDYQLAEFRHYTTKTAKEYCEKMRRGFPDQMWDGGRVQNLIETRFFRANKVTKEKIDIFKKELGIDMSYLLPHEYEGQKSDDVKIYSLCYTKKDFQFLEDSVITPLQVGAANGTEVCALKDNIGDNISDKNYLYIENTGTYWIWKNVKGCKYKGQMQYRRPLSGVTEEMDFDKIFDEYDVITCEPFYHPDHKEPTETEKMVIPADTVEQGYAFSNCLDDLLICEMGVKMLYPDYAEDWDKYIKNGSNLYYSNGFIMKASDYDKYCEFLFKNLEMYLKFTNINSEQTLLEHVKYNLEVGKYPRYQNTQQIPEQAVKWQMSILGFLSERLWTLWLQHNFKQDRIYKTPYIKMEENMYT